MKNAGNLMIYNMSREHEDKRDTLRGKYIQRKVKKESSSQVKKPLPMSLNFKYTL
jgi:hypothetical protein